MAAIYFAGTDCGDFYPQAGGLTSSTTTANIAPYMSRGIIINNVTVYGDFASSLSSLWLRFYYHRSSGTSANDWIYLRSGATDLFRVRRNASSGPILVQGWDGSTWSTLLDTGWAPTAATRYKIDIELVISNSGTISFYANDVQQGSTFSGDTLLTAETTVDKLKMAPVTGVLHTYSGVFVSDADTRPITMQQLSATGAGAETAWTGAYTDIDELGVPSDVDYISSGVANDVETFTKTAFDAAFASGYNCLGIWARARALRAASGPQNLQLVCRSGTTNGVSGSKALDVTMAPYGAFFATDPATSSAWAVADADSAQIGVKAIA